MKLLQFLQDNNGVFSSKRLFGLLCFIAAFVLAWQGKSASVIVCFTGPAAAVFIGQAITKSQIKWRNVKMLNAIWEALKVIIEDYVFAAEATGKTGDEKKKEVIAALGTVVDQAAAQYKLGGIVVSIIKFFVPLVIDAVVSKLNAEGKLNPSKAS